MNDERIVAWLDGELSSDEAAQLEAEIAADPTLQADVEQMRSVKIALQSLPRERAPRNFMLDVNEYGRTTREQFSIFSGWAVPALALAAVVLVAAVLFTQLPFGGGEEAIMAEDSAAEVADEVADVEGVVKEVKEVGVIVEEAADDASESFEVASDEIAADAPASTNTLPPVEAVMDDASDTAEDAGDNENAMDDRGAAVLVTEQAEFEQQIYSAPDPIWPFEAEDETEAQGEGQSAADIYDTFSYENTFSGALEQITDTDGTDGINPGTVEGGGTWADALRDLVIGFLILLLVICIFAFGLGMWILINRHQR